MPKKPVRVATKKAPCKAVINGSVCAGVKSLISKPLVNLLKYSEKTSPAWAIPNNIPKFLAVASKDAAVPACSFLTRPKTEELFGERNMACPHPNSASFIATSKGLVEAVRPVSRKRALVEMSKPMVAIILGSVWSDNQPAIGATINNVEGIAIMIIPMWEVGRLRMRSR